MPLLSPLLARSGWPACIGSIAEIDGDIAAYRGLKNSAQAVEIGMAEIVSGSPTCREFALLLDSGDGAVFGSQVLLFHSGTIM